MVDDPHPSYRWHPALSTLREARLMHSEHQSLTRAVVILTNHFCTIAKHLLAHPLATSLPLQHKVGVRGDQIC